MDNMTGLKQLEVIGKETKRLKEAERVIKRDRKNIEILKIKYNKGFEENKKTKKELGLVSIILTDRESKIVKKEKDNNNYLQGLEDRERKLEQKIDRFQKGTSNFGQQKVEFDIKEKQLCEKIEVAKRKEQEIGLSIEANAKKTILNDLEKTRLKGLEKGIKDQKILLVKAQKTLDEQTIESKKEASELDNKKIYIDKKSKEIDKSIKEISANKKEIAKSAKNINERAKAVEIKEKDVEKKELKVDKDKEKLKEETKSLSEWKETLTSISSAIKDRERLVNIDERKVREQLRIVQEIRKEINKGGN